MISNDSSWKGAYTARDLAPFISRVGIPRNQSVDVCRGMYRAYLKGELDLLEALQRVIAANQCITRVPIEALCCFDTVGTRGIPQTCILGILRWTTIWFKTHEFRGTTTGENIENFFHALALHENRKPFAPTLAHIPQDYERNRNFKQVWFPDSHHDLGRDHVNGGGLLTCALAWMISELDKIGVPFDKDALRRRFLRYGLGININETGLRAYNWLKDSVHQSKSGIWRLMGHQQRTPSGYSIPDMKTNEAIHISARLRNFGAVVDHDAVPGYHYRSSPESAGTWIETGTWEVNRNVARGRKALIEAPISALEATLLGLALPTVSEAALIPTEGPPLVPSSQPSQIPNVDTHTEPTVVREYTEEVIELAMNAADNSANGETVAGDLIVTSQILGAEEAQESLQLGST